MIERLKSKLSYTQIIVLSFLGLILLGSLLLSLPVSSRSGVWTPYLDALFTSTSATCVTGLIVADTYLYWSVFGQIVIIVLIQIGGLGVMTVFSLVAMMFRRKIGIAERRLMMEAAGNPSIGGIVSLLRRILLGTLIFEGAGAVILCIRFLTRGMNLSRALYNAVFHSISAFCNAGFDVMGRYGAYSSFTTFADDPVVLITLAALIIFGGIGFYVWSDTVKCRGRWSRLQLHTKVVLTASGVLVALGTGLFLLFEYNVAFKDMDFGTKLLNAFFQSVTPRTAGFNAVDLRSLSSSGSLLTMALMFVGGSPGSTAGGVKTTTLAVMLMSVVAAARHADSVNIFKRRIEDNAIRRAFAIITIYALAIAASTMLLCYLEPISIPDAAFEVFSATGTVGLSMGITGSLGAASRILIILLMFGGRVGGLSLALVLAEKRENVPISRPVDKIMIG